MLAWHKLLKAAHEIKSKNDLSYSETADVLEEVAKYYRWCSKKEIEVGADNALKKVKD